MTRFGSDQPLIVNNDWSVLRPPTLGGWNPRLSASVIIPAYNPTHLSYVLAGLAAQSYPAHLMEVVVVDDGSQPPVELPEVRPDNTRVIATEGGWARAAACHTGALQSEGDVLHWLDADMVPCHHEVEAHLRWHHLVDYAVVMGERLFVQADALDEVSPAEIVSDLRRGRHPRELARGDVAPSAWNEKILRETADLTTAGPRAMRLHVGASGSVGRDLYEQSGGMPVGLLLGEDIVLGYRLREAGAVFIPDRAASSLHLGSTGVARDEEATNRYNKPFITDLVPEFRGHRLRIPRSYSVPYLEVVLSIGNSTYEEVCAAVNAQLTCSVPDLVVTLVADWSGLTDERGSPLQDADVNLRMLQAAYAAEPRVRMRDRLPAISDATWRFTSAVQVFPAGRALDDLLHDAEHDHRGQVRVLHEDGRDAQLSRTASEARALRIGSADPASVTTVGEHTAEEPDFVAVASAPRVRRVRGLVPWGEQQIPSEDAASSSSR